MADRLARQAYLGEVDHERRQLVSDLEALAADVALLQRVAASGKTPSVSDARRVAQNAADVVSRTSALAALSRVGFLVAEEPAATSDPIEKEEA